VLTDPLGQKVQYGRDELGRETAKLLPNGVTTYHAYDAASQVTDIIHAGPGVVLQSLVYGYALPTGRSSQRREHHAPVH